MLDEGGGDDLSDGAGIMDAGFEQDDGEENVANKDAEDSDSSDDDDDDNGDDDNDDDNGSDLESDGKFKCLL